MTKVCFYGGYLIQNSSKLQVVQALRGVAALLVLTMHAFYESGLPRPDFFPFHIGVDIFFVISGFIMVYTSRDWFGTPGAWKKFISRRLVRIVPVYWFYTSVLLVVAFVMPSALQTVEFEPVHAVLSYFFIPHENPSGSLHPFLDLGWTLNYEMYFYAVFAAFMFLPLRQMIWALTAYFVFTVGAGAFATEDNEALYFWSRTIVLEFVAGAWIGYAYLRGVRLSGIQAVHFLAASVLLIFIEINPLQERALSIMGAAVLLVAAAVLTEGIQGRAVPRFWLALGDASYTLYLSHPFTLAAIALLGRMVLPPIPLFIASVLVAVLAGYILYLVVEKPLLSLSKRVFLRA